MSATAYPATVDALDLPWSRPRTRVAPALDPQRILRETLLVMGLLLLNLARTPGAVVFFIILAVMILRNPLTAFKALAICYVGLMLNSAFVPKTLVWTPARQILPMVALVRFSFDLLGVRYSLLSRASYVFLLVFAVTMAICSIASGWYTHIALLKIVNFMVFVSAALSGTAVLRALRVDISEWFVSLILAATLFGIASLALGVSNNFRGGLQLSNSTFNGAFLHPNLHATYASLFVSFMALVWILGRYRRTWLALPVIACWLVFMAWSGSRTSFIASLTGIAIIIAYARPARNRRGWLLRPNVKRGTLIAVGLAAVFGVGLVDVVGGGGISRSIVAFVNKSKGVRGERLDSQKILQSRQALIDSSIDNFKKNRVFGIGFGVAKTAMFERNATLFAAPAEKGFLPTAILEEGGILGTSAFLLFLAAFLGELVRERNVAGLVMFVVFLATNVGEVTIFSPGGAGSFGWITVAAGMILGDHCWAPPVPWGHRSANQHARSA